MSEENKKSQLELITNLLKVVLWPVIIIIVIIIFWSQIKGLLENSESISVGNLSLKIKSELPIPTQEVKEIVAKLGENEINELFYLGNDTSEYNGFSDQTLREEPIDRMVALGLLRPMGRNPDNTLSLYKTTQLGANTYNFYLSLVKTLAKNVSKP